MGNDNMSGNAWVLEFGVVAFATDSLPTVPFKPFDDFRAVHVILHIATQNIIRKSIEALLSCQIKVHAFKIKTLPGFCRSGLLSRRGEWSDYGKAFRVGQGERICALKAAQAGTKGSL